jgi:NADH-quinone oxidoreductase subunit G
VNVRLRKAVKRGAKVFLVGPEWETTFGGEFLGDDLAVLGNLPGTRRRRAEGRRTSGADPWRGGLAKGALGAALALAEPVQPRA